MTMAERNRRSDADDLVGGGQVGAGPCNRKTPYTRKLGAIFVKNPYPKDFFQVMEEAGMPLTAESKKYVRKFFKNARARYGTKRMMKHSAPGGE